MKRIIWFIGLVFMANAMVAHAEFDGKCSRHLRETCWNFPASDQDNPSKASGEASKTKAPAVVAGASPKPNSATNNQPVLPTKADSVRTVCECTRGTPGCTFWFANDTGQEIIFYLFEQKSEAGNNHEEGPGKRILIKDGDIKQFSCIEFGSAQIWTERKGGGGKSRHMNVQPGQIYRFQWDLDPLKIWAFAPYRYGELSEEH